MDSAFAGLAPGHYVVVTKPNEEFRARAHLAEQGFTVWIPLYRKPSAERTRPQRVTDIFRNKKQSLSEQPSLPMAMPESLRQLAPLFPRYIFVELGGEAPSSHLVRSTRGCVDVIRKPGGEPSRIPDPVMQSLRSRECDGVIELELEPQRPVHKFKHSEAIRVRMEGLADPAAKFLRYASGRTRAWVLMTFLGEETRVQVPMDVVEAVG